VPLAAVLAARAAQHCPDSTLVIDVDEFALTLASVAVSDGHLRLIDTHVLPNLGLRLWKERLLNALSDLCILQTRRDPRDSPLAEQALHDQIEFALDACQQGRFANLSIQAPQWYQNLAVQAEQVTAFCAGLVHQVVAETQPLLAETAPGMILLTAMAGRLPGLRAALQTYFGGEDNERATARTAAHVGVLAADSVALAAQYLAGGFLRGDLPHGHLHETLPLPESQSVEAGPARLLFEGKDYPLSQVTFTVGRHPGSDLVLETSLYPTVSARHCVIVYNHGTYTLCDQSRHGTLVNDTRVAQSVALRAGDWIRLGPDGPLLRFLGHVETQPRGTTATA
jgi:hypothetical protein